MSEELIPEREDLPNKPLVEAIFEVQWAFSLAEEQSEIDPGFRILLGRLYDRVRGEYPFLENLPQAQFPEEMTGRLVRHRFRTAKDGWPLVQIGPGVLSVNETQGYTWDGFRPRLTRAINALFESYPTDIHQLKVTQVLLRYLDAIPLAEGIPLLQFLKESLHTTVEVDARLFQDSHAASSPDGLLLNLVFRLPELPGAIALSFGIGKRENQPSIIWDTKVLAQAEDVPKTIEEYEAWLIAAHDLAGRWFRTLSSGKLYESFRRKES
ncbi:MAG: TIGR04255 family protein [Acidobacteria bacterium]|nr:TIGR04255 family protein [Acidobacteriota bacterium]